MAKTPFASPGSFCWNKDCPDYSLIDKGNMRRFGKTRRGIQRYQCRTCRKAFTDTKGTLFYGCHTPQEKILECLALLSERNSLAAIRRVKGVKEDTLRQWLKKAAQQTEAVEALLLANYKLKRVQIDALWTFVQHKGAVGKKGS